MDWIAIPFFRDLPDSGIEPGSPTLQVDNLASEPKAGPFLGNLTTYSKLKEPMETLLHLPYTSKQSMMLPPRFLFLSPSPVFRFGSWPDTAWASQVGPGVKNVPANARDKRNANLIWVGKIPWRKA